MHGAMLDDAPLWTLDRVSLGPARLREISVTISRGVTAVLSAMFLAAFAAPVAVLLLTAPAARWYARR